MRAELCADTQGQLVNALLDKGQTTGAYLAIANQVAYKEQSGGANIAISYTPSVNVWWDVEACIGILQKLDAAYHYAYANIWLNVNDAQARGRAQCIWTQHSTVNNYGFRHIQARFMLTGGTFYTATLMHENSGGSWQYYTDNPRNFMMARAWAR
jgi:hypothetical protein